jgi:5'-deoxynucleotidase YfbR-like HD superfamily hydrolase
MKNILENVGDAAISSEIMSLWMDYEEGRSVEALLAHQLDKFEMIVQAGEGCTSPAAAAAMLILTFFVCSVLVRCIYCEAPSYY